LELRARALGDLEHWMPLVERTGTPLTWSSATSVGKKWTSLVAVAVWNFSFTSSGRFDGTFGKAILILVKE
jgi:hypothetical protein